MFWVAPRGTAILAASSLSNSALVSRHPSAPKFSLTWAADLAPTMGSAPWQSTQLMATYSCTKQIYINSRIRLGDLRWRFTCKAKSWEKNDFLFLKKKTSLISQPAVRFSFSLLRRPRLQWAVVLSPAIFAWIKGHAALPAGTVHPPEHIIPWEMKRT